MWLQTKGSPYPTDRRVRIAACCCHRTDRPMRGIFWRRTQRALDHSGNLIIIDRARPARASFIQEPFDAILQKPSTPFADRVLMNAKLVCNRLAQESRRRTAGWPDSAPIMTAPPDGPGLKWRHGADPRGLLTTGGRKKGSVDKLKREAEIRRFWP